MSTEAGWVSVSAFGLARAITGQINNQVLVGEELSKSMHQRQGRITSSQVLASNAEYAKAAMRYSHDVAVAMEICRQLPKSFVP